MPHFLFKEQADAFKNSSAKKIMIFNLPDKSTSDEFSGISLEEHLQLVLDHVPDLTFDIALIDKVFEGKEPGFTQLVERCGGRVITLDLADNDVNFHHDKNKLISAFTHIFR
jgi:2-phospho-L-lactate transferase/gluconeogenesis factor (CofD/UPF0052 family)